MNFQEENGMMSCKSWDTPLDPNHKFNKDSSDRLIDSRGYQRLIGKLIFLFWTWPNIAYTVNVVGQCTYAPTTTHLEVGSYKYNSQAYKIYSWKGPTILQTAIYMLRHKQMQIRKDLCQTIVPLQGTFVGGNLVTWRSTKQLIVAKSSAKAEFRSMAHRVGELLYEYRYRFPWKT